MKTTVELSVILHFDRKIDDTRAVRDNVSSVIGELIDYSEIAGKADSGALVDEYNVSTVRIIND